MIAACIEKMRTDGCAGCERRDACAELMRRFGVRLNRPRPSRPRRPVSLSPFLAFLGDVAAQFQRGFAAPASAFRRSVEAQIEALLPGGARMVAVARALGCSRQTLYRRLREEGEGFERLVERVRRRLALRLLGDPAISVKEAAYRLGFAEPAAFSRAFKRWTGRSPAAWRSAQASG
ncbi:MAG: helix-turn-helix transcriptional regulator [Alphaproteobacteria bacterium]|nr:helix-turn-helix transcriptional regulator [Alphaproteobacteria bacterium]